MIDLHAELWRAMQFARAPEVNAMWSAVLPRRIQWGIARVEFFGADRQRQYEPQVDGRSLAFVVPVVEDGDIVDLCAIDGISEHVGLRLGIGHGLGLDSIEKARVDCCELHLVARPLQWLRFPWCSSIERRLPVEAVYLFDLHEVAIALDRVAPVVCNTIEFAERVASLLPPSERQRVVLP